METKKQNKKKLVIALALLAVIVVASVVTTVVLVLAASQQNVTSNVSINYVARDVDGTVTLTYKRLYGNSDFDSSYQTFTSNSVTFTAGQAQKNETLSIPSDTLKFGWYTSEGAYVDSGATGSDGQKFVNAVVLKFDFTNDSYSKTYDITGTITSVSNATNTSDATATYTIESSTDGTTFAQVTELSGGDGYSVLADALEVAFKSGSTAGSETVYIKISVSSTIASSADFSASINWTLEANN